MLGQFITGFLEEASFFKAACKSVGNGEVNSTHFRLAGCRKPKRMA